MYDVFLSDLASSVKNSYELVMSLKGIKEQGIESIHIGKKSMPVGKLMYIIVSRSKEGYTLSEILSEIRTY